METKRINVIGLGYIGLPTAVILAKSGYEVVGTDIDKDLVDSINNCKFSTTEPRLDDAVKYCVKSGLLNCSSKLKHADIYIICVPTPIDKKTKAPDLRGVFEVVVKIAPLINPNDIVIIESTCPVGTLSKVKDIFLKLDVDVNKIHLAQCPERVLPGRIMSELIENDRIVGGLTAVDTKVAANFYRTFVTGEVFETNAPTAEMCKLAENSFRDVNIAFANELSIICDKENISIGEVISLANKHPRVEILQPGPGVGGHCIAVDPWFIVSKNRNLAPLIWKARQVNDAKPNWVLSKISQAVDEYKVQKKKEPRIACLGLSFKPDIDDLRESPSLEIALTLQAEGYDVFAVEPNICSHEKLVLMNEEDALKKASLFVFLVKHREFIHLVDEGRFKNSWVLDFCGILAREA